MTDTLATQNGSAPSHSHHSLARGIPQLQALQIAIAANQPTILWGLPGEGKSSTIESMTKAHGIHLEVIIGSQFEPVDIAGQPWVVETADGKQRMEHLLPSWASAVVDLPRGQPSVVFFDELDKCMPAVQNACLRVVRERVVGDIHLPATCRVIAAANLPETGGFDLTAPMSNRLLHIDWVLDPITVFVGIGADLWPSMTPLTLQNAQIEAAKCIWRARLASYLSARPQLIRILPETEQAQGRPWPSPRSWESITAVAAIADVFGAAPAVMDMLVKGLVGQAVGSQFLEWVRGLPTITPVDVLSPDFQLPQDPDHVNYSAMLAVSAAAMNPDLIEQAQQLCVKAYHQGFQAPVQAAAITLERVSERTRGR